VALNEGVQGDRKRPQVLGMADETTTRIVGIKNSNPREIPEILVKKLYGSDGTPVLELLSELGIHHYADLEGCGVF
jgi:hypothetical protein